MNVDMIVQNVSAEGHTGISFTLPRTEMRRAVEALEPLAAEIEARGLAHTPGIAKISLVGAGMRTPLRRGGHVRCAGCGRHQHRDHLDLAGADLVRVPAAQVERAVQAVHECFQLHEPVVSAEA